MQRVQVSAFPITADHDVFAAPEAVLTADPTGDLFDLLAFVEKSLHIVRERLAALVA